MKRKELELGIFVVIMALIVVVLALTISPRNENKQAYKVAVSYLSLNYSRNTISELLTDVHHFTVEERDCALNLLDESISHYLEP